MTIQGKEHLRNFDIVFYFAVEDSLGIPDKLRDVTKETLQRRC